MTLNLTKPDGTLSANVETVIRRVEQDYKPDGSITLTIHTTKWLILHDGSKLEIDPWARHSATYPNIATMIALTAQTWNPDQETREALASEILAGATEASDAVLGAYGDILNAAQAAMAARDAQAQE